MQQAFVMALLDLMRSMHAVEKQGQYAMHNSNHSIQ